MSRNATQLVEPRPERARSAPRHAKPARGVVERMDGWRERAKATPRVVPIYWDAHFESAAADVAAFDEFLRTLFQSSWMSGLKEFGVGSAELLPSFVPSEPRPARLSHAALETQLKRWLSADVVTPKPKKAERSLFYLILTPLGTELSLGAVSSPTHVSGYHDRARFEADARTRSVTGEPNLHYAVVPLVSTEAEILDAHSRAICHELAQSFIAAARGR